MGKLVQLTLDKSPLPIPFDQIQCANLVGWNGEADAPGWRKARSSSSPAARGFRSRARGSIRSRPLGGLVCAMFGGQRPQVGRCWPRTWSSSAHTTDLV